MRKNNRLKIKFFEKYKFPTNGVGTVHHGGWFKKDHEDLLLPLVKDKKLVLELGTWLGKSTTNWLKNSEAHVICVDTWEGSIEHKNRKRYKKLLSELKSHFLANVEKWQDRLSILQMNTICGMAELYRHGIKPDFIYIDASHEYEDVFVDISLAYNYFPNAMICGDDWEWDSVKLAITKFCKYNNLEAESYGTAWYIK